MDGDTWSIERSIGQAPRVLVEQDGWRLVLTRRDPEQWRGSGDSHETPLPDVRRTVE